MRVNGNIPDSRTLGNYEIKIFFFHMNMQRTHEQHSRISRIFKHIQGI